MGVTWAEHGRLQLLNEEPERDGEYVLYWMQQSQREGFNPALEAAAVCANRLGLPVLVGFGLTDDYPEANAPERAIFGKVRSMTAAGLERKIDGDAYLHRVEELAKAESVRDGSSE